VGLTFADDMYIMKHQRKREEKEKKMKISKTYKITYKPFHYSDETVEYTGSVCRFTYPARSGYDGVLIQSGNIFHNLTLCNIVAYEEI
jgi:hypothetical protein